MKTRKTIFRPTDNQLVQFVLIFCTATWLIAMTLLLVKYIQNVTN